MTVLSKRLKVKEVLFYLALALASGLIHLFILLTVNINYTPFEKGKLERQMMRVGFVRTNAVKAARAPKPRATPKPSLTASKKTSTKKVAVLPAKPVPGEEIEEEEEEEAVVVAPTPKKPTLFDPGFEIPFPAFVVGSGLAIAAVVAAGDKGGKAVSP